MARQACYKTGDWGRARQVVHRLPSRLARVIDTGMEEEAESAARRIRNNIFTQSYAHAELAQSTKDTKAEEGKDPRTLIEDGEYVRAISAMRLRKNVWGIGVEEEELGDIGVAHEYGTEEMPARPHYRVELERITAGRLLTIRQGMKRVLEGRD